MTFETKYLIDFPDILALEFECKNEKCHAKVTLSLGDSKRMMECPVCHSDWLLPQTREEESIRLLVGALRDATENLKGRPFSLRLQVVAPPTP